MKISTQLQAHRIILLYKYSLNLHYKQLLIGLGATIAVIAGFHVFFHIVNFDYLNNKHVADKQYHIIVLSVSFVAGCLLWCGHAFPKLRSKESSMDYLMLPASVLEKFTFELLNRIVWFILFFPLLYWATTNLVTVIFHALKPDYVHYKFQYSALFSGWNTKDLTLFFSMVLLLFTVSFAGASSFRKLPLVKTILLFFLIGAVYFGYASFVVLGLDLQEYAMKDNRVLFMHGLEEAKTAAIIAGLAVNFTLLLMSYFKIKEKEL